MVPDYFFKQYPLYIVEFRKRNIRDYEEEIFCVPTIHEKQNSSIVATVDPFFNLFLIGKIDLDIDSNEKVDKLLNNISDKESEMSKK